MTDDIRTDKHIMVWGQEATWGDPASTPNGFGLFDTARMPDPGERWKYFFGVGTSRNRGTALRGPIDCRGSIPDILLQANCGPLLALILGRISGTQVLEGVSDTDSRCPSFTMVSAAREETDGAYPFSRQWSGGKVSRASFMCREEEELRLSLDELIFKDIAHSLSNDDLGSLSPGFTGGHNAPPEISDASRFTYAGAQLTFGEVIICSVKNWGLTVDNNLTPRRYLCLQHSNSNLTQFINDLQEGKRIYKSTVGIDVLSEDTDLALFQFLVDQAGDPLGSATPTKGFNLQASFLETPGEGVSALVFNLAVSPSTNNVGTVVENGSIDPQPPPSMLFSGDYNMDTSDVTIDLPTDS